MDDNNMNPYSGDPSFNPYAGDPAGTEPVVNDAVSFDATASEPVSSVSASDPYGQPASSVSEPTAPVSSTPDSYGQPVPSVSEPTAPSTPDPYGQPTQGIADPYGQPTPSTPSTPNPYGQPAGNVYTPSNNYGGPTNGYTGPTNSYGGNSYNSSYNGTGYNATRPTLQPEDGKATAGIILSICSLVFCCLGVILAPIGMVLSKQAINAGNDSGKAKAGWICGIIGLVLNILFIVMYIVLIALGIANS